MQNTKLDRQTTIRESGVELLKIIAIFLIVVSHVMKTHTYLIKIMCLTYLLQQLIYNILY